jgi:pimeloyl-ACP methyl ester carboxylesterase
VQYTVKGRQMAMACFGTGSPTVLVIPGLTASTSNWEAVARTASARTRVCTWDRPGLGQSEQRAAGARPSVGDMGRELTALLAVAHVDPPYVVVAHSFGGLVARAFIAQRPADVTGVLMVDASTVGELRSPYFAGIQWWEGGSKTDVPRSIRELDAAGSLGSTPLVVLTADSSGDLKRNWFPLQKTLAGLSSDSVHALAVGSGHVIQDDKPKIVLGAIAEVVEAAAAGSPLPACATTFPQLGGRCF